MVRPDRLRTVFAQYVAAFNAQDRDALTTYLSPDVVFDWGDVMPPLVGRRAFDDFFAEMWTHLREHVVATDVEVDGCTLTAVIANRIVVFRDWPESPLAPMAAGDSFTVSGPMAYRFDGTVITRITDLSDTDTDTPTPTQETP